MNRALAPANLPCCDPTPQTPSPSKLPPRALPPHMPSTANPPTHRPAHRVPLPIPSRPPETTANPIPLPRQFADAPPQPSFCSELSRGRAAQLPHSTTLRPSLPAPATASQSRLPPAPWPAKPASPFPPPDSRYLIHLAERAGLHIGS